MSGHAELWTKDLDLWLTESNDDGEPVRLLGTVDVCGICFHVSCERVEEDEEQVAWPGGSEEAVAAIQSLDKESRQMTVAFEGYPGNWLVVFTPYCL